MKTFALKDGADPDHSTLAVLCYYEGADEYYIDMPEGTDPWIVPFILSSHASRGRWSVGASWSRRWVESRLVPRSRQNLGEILRVNGLDDFDALRLLEMTEGRNSQDDCYLEPLGTRDWPRWFQERERRRIVEAVALENGRLVVAFRSGSMRYYRSEDVLSLNPALGGIVDEQGAFELVKVMPGGRGLRWGHGVTLRDGDLADAGTPLPLSWADLARIAPVMLVDAAEAAELLGCTRQNLHALAKRGSLPVAKTGGKATLFLRADVQSRAAGSAAPIRYAYTSLPPGAADYSREEA